jgi:hypothetical protein
MKHLYLTLGYLREQRSKLDSSISLLETLLGGNGNGHKGTLKLAGDALALHEEINGTERRPKARRGLGQKVNGQPRQRAAAAMKPLPQIDIPKGLNVEGLKLDAAVVAALKAYKKPADTKHLTALLLGGGFKWNSPMPFSTRVGSFVGRERKHLGIKGDRTGWQLR